ncbi:MAG: three-Cys-motif partner protein TcmP [Dehalococcoidia bacterium]
MIVKQQAVDKHFFVARYVDIFATAMKRKWPERVYVDLFAGPGKCCLEQHATEEYGSPLIALNTRFGFTRYFFNDREPLFAEALRERCSAYRDACVTVLNEDCNAAAAHIAEAIPANALSLTFVDPFNWEIRFDSLASLTAGRAMDLVITFHSGNIKRAADYNLAALDDFFGDKQWKERYDSARVSGTRQGTRVLLDCYESSLRRIGYPHIRDQVGINSSRGTRLYHLVLASKHPRAPEFWDKISARDRGGQGHLF